MREKQSIRIVLLFCCKNCMITVHKVIGFKMSLYQLYQLENTYYSKFIEALHLDMGSSKHSGEINHQVLKAAVSLLQEPERYTSLSLDQIIIGTMNMAIGLQIAKYRNISSDSVGEAIYNKYLRESRSWFLDFHDRIKSMKELSDEDSFKLAIPVIERAAQSPLYLTPCVPNTLKLYFEYYQQLNEDFVPPNLPSGNTFGPWSKEQFICLNTSYSSSLLNLSLFAVKANQLSTKNLPEKLKKN